MRPILYILSFLAVLATAFWAYRENYATQHQLKQMAKIQDEIAALRDEIAMQKAEWAYENRPARLRDLAAMNFDRLGLMPMEPRQLGDPGQVAMPPVAPLVITGTVATEGSLTPDAADPTAKPAAKPPVSLAAKLALKAAAKKGQVP